MGGSFLAQDRDRKHMRPTAARTAEASKAWLDELVRTGQVIDETEQAMRRGLGGILLTGMPEPEKKPDAGLDDD